MCVAVEVVSICDVKAVVIYLQGISLPRRRGRMVAGL